MVAEQKVVVALAAGGRAPDTLTYTVPAELAQAGLRGTIVSVPLGSRRVAGIVLGPSEEPTPRTLKPIAAQLGEARIPPEVLDLAAWASSYYRAPEALLRRALMPPDTKGHTRKQIIPSEPRSTDKTGKTTLFAETEPMGTLEERILARLPDEGLAQESLRADFGKEVDAAVRRLVRKGRLRIEEVEVERRPPARPLRATAGFMGEMRRARRQADLLTLLQERAPHAVTRDEIAVRFPGASRLIKALLERGAIEEASEDALPRESEPGPTLRAEQALALAEVESTLGTFSPFLLFGITGSGKTEVHLRAAQAARQRGLGALLLVPEIGLTPQLVSQATARFPGDVAVLHSGLSDAERTRTWHDVASGRLNIVIGPRSAIFAPIHNLGLIVVDEEHDGAYKQGELPRYHGRDVAVMRAKLASCPIILASATPSLESWQNAKSGRYQLLRLTTRANDGPLPTVRLVDMREIGRGHSEIRRAGLGATDLPGPAKEGAKRRGIPLFASELEDALRTTFAAGEQSLLFLNRRGWSRFLQCDACGHVDTCPDCSVSLTIHRKRNAAICHHCGFARPPVTHCPDCESPLESRSFGTEQVEANVRDLLPEARIARLDGDTGSRPGHLHATVDAWRAGELDVLVGTQMVAKGHDAPGVTLIGVVLADSSLHFPDFRAAERTFQLLAQVAGRAGRGDKPGRVLVQTRQPEHPSLLFARNHDFEGFAAAEMISREALSYPPFGRLARIVIEGPPASAAAYAERVATHLRRAAGALVGIAPGDVLVLGPAPAPLERLRGRERHQILVKARSASELSRTLAHAALESRTARDIRTIIDVDPTGML
ncbi:MAG: primosomal protein N' [Deltaproteobacteria bacterium]